jgi:hypothetical protein
MYPLHLLCDKAAICKSTNSQILKTSPLIFNFLIFVLIKYKVISLIYNLSFKIEIFKSNRKNGKFNPNHNPKSTLITTRALTHNTCYTHIIKKESKVLDS